VINQINYHLEDYDADCREYIGLKARYMDGSLLSKERQNNLNFNEDDFRKTTEAKLKLMEDRNKRVHDGFRRFKKKNSEWDKKYDGRKYPENCPEMSIADRMWLAYQHLKSNISDDFTKEATGTLKIDVSEEIKAKLWIVKYETENAEKIKNYNKSMEDAVKMWNDTFSKK
jgi:hypothetical protein